MLSIALTLFNITILTRQRVQGQPKTFVMGSLQGLILTASWRICAQFITVQLARRHISIFRSSRYLDRDAVASHSNLWCPMYANLSLEPRNSLGTCSMRAVLEPGSQIVIIHVQQII